MSASTVSITANPATRRRPVVATEKKATSIEVVEATVDDKVIAAISKDLSHHSIRGEATLSKDLGKKSSSVAPNSNNNNNSSLPLRRARNKVGPTGTTTTRPDHQPRWITIFRVFAKNFVLLVVLAGLAQLVRKLALKPDFDGNAHNKALAGTQMEFEGRIAEVEAFLKTTAKMIQVQVEVVDRKIDSEIGGVRREIAKKIEDRSVVLENQLKELEAKSEGLEKSLGELKSVEWLSKEEFEKIYEDLRTARSKEYGEDDGQGSLDEIRAYAREMIEREIEKHAADGLGRVDYALATGGAVVVKHSEPFAAGKGSNWFLMGGRSMVHNNADKMLRPSFGEPGQCFALSGTSGFVQIKLRTAIVPEAVTLEHVAKSVAYDRSSAPKDCRVSGWLQGHNMDVAVDAEHMFLLTEFTYDLEKSNAQTFNLLDSAGSGIVDTIRLDFTSNHGSPSHTCIYRFRVHGREPDSVSMMAMQS
ncbi:SUN domain-containing protein 1-like [Fagus crenata]